MSEEATERFTPFETRVLRGLANTNLRLTGLEGRMDRLEVRLTNLEEKAHARLHDTRPIREALLSGLNSIEARLDGIEVRPTKTDAKFDVITKDMTETRTDVEMLKRRPPAA